MKVLFLDIDGVLNRDGTEERCLFYTGVDRVLSERLLSWMKDKDIKIVLSSTWRNYSEMHDHLREAGLEWIDVTPDHRNKQERLQRMRGAEIAEWLSNHPEVTQYAILDDATDMLSEQRPYFVNTNPDFGVQEHDLEMLSRIL